MMSTKNLGVNCTVQNHWRRHSTFIRELVTRSRSGMAEVHYRPYEDENDLPKIMQLVDNELSEPYSIFTYRYLINQWPQFCFTAHVNEQCVGTVVCKIDEKKSGIRRGYIAMLVVIKPMRGKGIATNLVTRSIEAMRNEGFHEVALEAEVTNKRALALYSKLGFIRSKRLHRHYLNGVDAFRLTLRFTPSETQLAKKMELMKLQQAIREKGISEGSVDIPLIGISSRPPPERFLCPPNSKASSSLNE